MSQLKPLHVLKPLFVITTLSSLLLVSACTWVKFSEGAEDVELRSANEVAKCEKLGATSASVVDHVGFFDRNEKKVAVELQTLASNQAFAMGGNTVVVDSAITDGSQRFLVYKCP